MTKIFIDGREGTTGLKIFMIVNYTNPNITALLFLLYYLFYKFTEVFMYERMLNKQSIPTIEEMTKFCGENSERFSLLNKWLVSAFNTEQKIVFPYGNKYGWGVAHKKKNKLVCNVFAENSAFTVMIRLSDKQYKTVYDQLQKYTQECIDNKYPCGDSGWIHYRVTCKEDFDDIKTLLSVKCS